MLLRGDDVDGARLADVAAAPPRRGHLCKKTTINIILLLRPN